MTGVVSSEDWLCIEFDREYVVSTNRFVLEFLC